MINADKIIARHHFALIQGVQFTCQTVTMVISFHTKKGNKDPVIGELDNRLPLLPDNIKEQVVQHLALLDDWDYDEQLLDKMLTFKHLYPSPICQCHMKKYI